MINGERAFLSKSEYDEQKNEITAIEGIAVIAGGEKFAIHLNDAQSGYLSSVETATKLYGDIMPTAEQGKIISAKCTDINNAIQQQKIVMEILQTAYIYIIRMIMVH